MGVELKINVFRCSCGEQFVIAQALPCIVPLAKYSTPQALKTELFLLCVGSFVTTCNYDSC